MDHTSQSGQEGLRALHDFSSQLWGNQDRFLIAAAVAAAPAGDLYAQAIAAGLGIADTRVGPHLARLEKLGLLVRMPKVGGERRVYFERRNEAFWQAVGAMRTAIAE